MTSVALLRFKEDCASWERSITVECIASITVWCETSRADQLVCLLEKGVFGKKVSLSMYNNLCSRSHLPQAVASPVPFSPARLSLQPRTSNSWRQTSAPPLRPRPGALVVSINSTPVSHLRLSAVTAMLDELASKASNIPPGDGGNAGGGGNTADLGRPNSSTIPQAMTSAKPAHRSRVLHAGNKRGGRTTGSDALAAAGTGWRTDGDGGGYGTRQKHQEKPHQQGIIAGRGDKGGNTVRRSSRSSRSSRGGRKKIRILLREVDVNAWPPNWRCEVFWVPYKRGELSNSKMESK